MTALLLSAVAPASAATSSEFYATLLRRGISAYDAQRYADASKQLRIAAFGLVEAVDQYQVAQAYLTLAYDKLSDPDKAREAARRVVIAERVERRWATVTLPAAVRTAFDAQAAKLLTASELATLRGTGPVAPPPAPAASTAPRTVTTTPPQTTSSTPPRTTQTAAATPPRTGQTTTATPPRTTETTVPMGQTTTTTAPPPATVPAPAPATTQPRSTTNSSTPNTTTAKPPAPAPPPATVTATPPRTTTPATTPATTQPQRPATQTTSQPQRPATQTTTQPQRPATQTPAAPAARTFTPGEIATRLVAAERALNTANLIDARRVYRELLASASVPHETLIRIAEGLYRARDFAAALQAFTRAGTLRRGEEPYRYYIAVAAYETGDTARAKKELAAALPFIEMTPDVTRYRAKIEGAL